MLVADDYLLELGSWLPYWASSILRALCCRWRAIIMAQDVWGDTLVWVGFEILLRSHSVGISSRRAEWFVSWAEKVASSTTIHMASFEEGLGRIVFVAGALEHERPFLAPLYKFLTMHPRNAVRRVPPYVSFILRYLAGEITKKRHCECGTRITPSRLFTEGRRAG